MKLRQGQGYQETRGHKLKKSLKITVITGGKRRTFTSVKAARKAAGKGKKAVTIIVTN